MKSYEEYNDRELLALLRESDAHALAELYARYSVSLYNHAYNRFPYREEVRDIIQELFIYLWDQRTQLNFTTSLTSYLYAAVRNRLISQYRKQKVRSTYVNSLQSFIDKGDYITDEHIREKDLLELINKEIALLPPQMRLIFELSRNQHLTHNEIAEKLNLSTHTIRTQIRNALRILRSKLDVYWLLLFL